MQTASMPGKAGGAAGDPHERDREAERAERERDHRRVVGRARTPLRRELLRAPLDLLLDPVGEAVDELRLELLARLVRGRRASLRARGAIPGRSGTAGAYASRICYTEA